jgi:3-deoxy-D-manno-octulosonic-acid transferase
LRHLFGIPEGIPVLVAGSTQAPEEEIILDIFRRLRRDHPTLRLIVVPRQKDRFDEVAGVLERSREPFVRRTAMKTPDGAQASIPPIILVDTIGELGAVWGLAQVAFVGGSLDGKRGGQNMIEPAAYGAVVVFGPHVWNFRDTAQRLVQAGAARQIADAAGLEAAIRDLLASATDRERFAARAREFVAGQQGATERTVAMLGELLQRPHARRDAA